jgi:hypothetical protein
MRWVLPIVVFGVLLAIGALMVVGLSHFSPTEISRPAALPPPAQAPKLPPPAVGSQWRYTQPRLSPASEPGVQACTKASADVTIDGGAPSAVLLCLRRGGGYPPSASIALADPKGRLGCTDCTLQVRFDGGGAQGVAGAATSPDGANFTFFARDGAGFAAQVERASSLTVVLPVHGAGDQSATFDVAGLRWRGSSPPS